MRQSVEDGQEQHRSMLPNNNRESTLAVPRPDSRTHNRPGPMGLTGRPGPNRRLSSKPSMPDISTASPQYTGARNFSSEYQLQHSINWHAVQSRPIFDGPPTFQKLWILLNPPSESARLLHPAVRQQLNSDEHITFLQTCWSILKKGSKEDLQLKFGFPERVGDMRYDIFMMWILVKLAWRIVQALKNARSTTRISEVGEWALYIIETNKTVSPNKFDPVPLLTLACSLTYAHPSLSLLNKSNSREKSTPLKRSERDKLALKYFEEGFTQPNHTINNMPSNIYAKAHYARLLRRLERPTDAEIVEEEIRAWWSQGGRSLMSKSRLVDLVCCEGEIPSDSPILGSLEGFKRDRSESRDSARDSGIDVSPPSGPTTQDTLKAIRAGGYDNGPFPSRDYISSGSSESITSQTEDSRMSRPRGRIAL